MSARSTAGLARQPTGGIRPASVPRRHRLFLTVLPTAVVAVVIVISVLVLRGVGFLPMLSLGPALAAISWRPLPTALMGAVTLALGTSLTVYDNQADTRRGVMSLATITGIAVAAVIASAARQRQERELATIRSVAEAAQQILLRQVPEHIPPVEVAVRYVSASVSARIGGDLYEAISVDGCVRLIVGDVLGKGLPAARTAAVTLGTFREAAYDAPDLAQIAARIEASLQRQEADEEFVTAVLAQVSSDGPRVEILNCGHPPPLLVRDGEVTAVCPAEADVPLGLGSLAQEKREVCATIRLKRTDRLLFYTDGISEARDRRGTFYPLEASGAILASGDLGLALDRLIAEVRRHVGHALLDDAAMLLLAPD
jgi:serine phosphatase RsbU (regulator of sigma subunit)